MSRDETIVACVLVASSGSVYPGSAAKLCHDCRRPVWVSPASLRALDRLTAVAVCLDCASSRIDGNPESKFGVLPGTAQEFDAWLRRH
jgi:hypothetical protein